MSKFFLTVTIVLTLLVLSYPLVKFAYKNVELFPLFLSGAVYIFFLSFESFYAFTIYAVEKTRYIAIKEAIDKVLKILAVVLISFVLVGSYQIASLLTMFIIISFLLILYSKHYCYKFIPELKSDRIEKINRKKINKFIKFMTLASVDFAGLLKNCIYQKK